MGITDFIGGRGEAIAYTHLSQVCRDDDLPYFWPHYLGEKCETFDFLVELVDAAEKTPFFFVQVKATRKDFTKRQAPPRLRVEVSEKDVRRMSGFPAHYLCGRRPRGRGAGVRNFRPRDHAGRLLVADDRPRTNLRHLETPLGRGAGVLAASRHDTADVPFSELR